MADFSSVVLQSFTSGDTPLSRVGLESDAFRKTLQRVAADGVMTEREGYALARAYNRGVRDFNTSDNDPANDVRLLNKSEIEDVAERATEARSTAQRKVDDFLDNIIGRFGSASA